MTNGRQSTEHNGETEDKKKIERRRNILSQCGHNERQHMPIHKRGILWYICVCVCVCFMMHYHMHMHMSQYTQCLQQHTQHSHRLLLFSFCVCVGFSHRFFVCDFFNNILLVDVVHIYQSTEQQFSVLFFYLKKFAKSAHKVFGIFQLILLNVSALQINPNHIYWRFVLCAFRFVRWDCAHVCAIIIADLLFSISNISRIHMRGIGQSNSTNWTATAETQKKKKNRENNTSEGGTRELATKQKK